MSVNLRAPFILAKGIFLGMKALGGGVIVNISSMAAFYGANEHGVYSVSKSGLNGLTSVMACEWA